jgi:hypothetical protein
MHNQIMCYHHRVDDIPTVIENDPFLLENLDTREAIQRALGQVAARLACNHMDFERAKLLLQTINFAMRNLPPHPRPTSQPAPHPSTVKDQQPSTDDDSDLQEREYTVEERAYLKFSAMLGVETKGISRPASLSDEVIRAEVNNFRKAWGKPPIDNLILSPAQEPEPTPEPQPTPNSATLPTLNAAADPSCRLPLATSHSIPASRDTLEVHDSYPRMAP